MPPVLSALVPVLLLIAVGYGAGRRRWVGPGAIRDLANLVFYVLAPALLFRTMAGVRLEQLTLLPLVAYFGAALLVFAGVLGVRGFTRESTVLALAATFSNTVMIGVPLITLAFGQAGLVQLLPLISVHALILLTVATVALELAVQREGAGAGGAPGRRIVRAVLLAVRSAVLHPVPLPILAGVLFGMTGLVLPDWLERPLVLLGQAFGPIALLMVGASLGHGPIGGHWRGAIGVSLLKNFAHPVLVFAIAWGLGLRGLPLQVVVLSACLPIGANVFLFAQRYRVAEEVVTAGVAVSTLLTAVSLSLALAALALVLG